MNEIIGIGIDIVSVPRIERIYYFHKDKFIKKIFTDAEIDDAAKKGHFILSIAGKFAAKEAFFKANPEKILNPKLIEILSDKDNKPSLNLLNKNISYKCYLSISHEKEIAIAIVILS